MIILLFWGHVVGFSLLDQFFFKVQATGRVVYCVVIFGKTLEGGGGREGVWPPVNYRENPVKYWGRMDGWPTIRRSISSGGEGVSNNDCCLTLKISVVILLTVRDTILMIFVWRVWYHLILYWCNCEVKFCLMVTHGSSRINSGNLKVTCSD